MGEAKRKFVNRLHRHLTLMVDNTKEEELDNVYAEVVLDDEGDIIEVRSRRPTSSGIRKRVSPPPLPEVVRKRPIEPKRFVVAVHYHYPLVIFPPKLKEEIERLEEFFGIKLNQRGEGTVVQEGRLLATTTYRVNMRADTARGFSKTLRELLDRYGVEVIDSTISRT